MSSSIRTDIRAELTIKVDGKKDRRYLLRLDETFVLGRGQETDIHIQDRGVSRQHASLVLRSDGVYVTDLGSRNGTYLGRHRLPPNKPTLQYGDELARLGEHTIRIRVKGKKGGKAKSDEVFHLPFLPPDEFEILGEAGRGGLATVWAARQKLLDRKVAIKVLRAQIDPNLDGHKRFIREARLYTKVKSPYVLELYDVRMHHGRPYLILELVQGPTAKARLGGGRLMIPEALRICEDIARALIALSEAGIVHRDVKPSNILITPKGRAKLADFGLAKRMEGTSFTNTDMGLGSLPYVAPEQATGAKSVDVRSDLYSLGATLYQMITGRPPITFAKNENLLDRVRKIESEVPFPLQEYRSDCPPGIDRLVQRLLAKKPADRPKTPGRVAAGLAALRETHYPDWKHDEQGLFSETWEVQREDLGLS